ncbi:hypothetical protein F1880_005725 [Penicillium rolfsii]|nr:hypothetical protein F1880_005725 [Penicillium rolfsii]
MSTPAISSPQKRVRRACEYCRSKRLKCTAEHHPCMNCQLYHAECIFLPEVPGPRKRRRRRDRNNTNDKNTAPEQYCSPRSTNEHADELVDQTHPLSPSSTSPLGDLSGTAGPLPAGASNPYLDPAVPNLPTFEHAIRDGNIGLVPDFWELDSFVTGCRPGSEQAAAEQLLTLQSPLNMNIGAEITHSNSSHLNSAQRYEKKIGGGRFMGIERLASQPPPHVEAISPGLLLGKGEGNSAFWCQPSVAAIIALCIHESTDERHRLAESESLRFIANCGPLCDEISSPESIELCPQQGPSSTLAKKCIDTFFDDYYAPYPMFDRVEVELILNRYQYCGYQGLHPLERSILYLVIALGASSRSPPTGENACKGVDVDNLYALAWALFPQVVGTPSLSVRIGQSLGLHVALPNDLEQDPEREPSQLNIRARVWAVSLILDTHLSMSQGRPPASQLTHCNSDLLSVKSQFLQVSELPWPQSEMLRWRVSLALIQHRINLAFCSETTHDQRVKCLEKWDLELMKWKEQLPPQFQPEQQTILEGDAHIDIYTLHLDYFNIVQTLHWGLINHGPDARAHLAPRLRVSESICLGASLALVRTLNVMNDANSRARHFRARSDYFLTAMAIIYRHIARNPTSLSALTHAEYLRVLKLRLDRMADQHLLPPSLTSLVENMVKGAQDILQENSASFV